LFPFPFVVTLCFESGCNGAKATRLFNTKKQKMKKYDGFIPRPDSEALVWNNNYSVNIALLGATVGLLPADITDQQDAATQIADSIGNVNMQRNKLGQAVADKNALRADVEAIIRKMIARIKTHPAYTEAIGRALGIVDIGLPLRLEEQKPVIRLDAFPGYISVRFKLKGMKGVTIYSRIRGAVDWVMLAHDYKSPYLDNRPLQEAHQPEIREYIAMFFDGRKDVGLPSDIAVIVYGG
jgi:hypothetical protein